VNSGARMRRPGRRATVKELHGRVPKAEILWLRRFEGGQEAVSWRE
jgi:hypothetical protein